MEVGPVPVEEANRVPCDAVAEASRDASSAPWRSVQFPLRKRTASHAMPLPRHRAMLRARVCSFSRKSKPRPFPMLIWLCNVSGSVGAPYSITVLFNTARGVAHQSPDHSRISARAHSHSHKAFRCSTAPLSTRLDSDLTLRVSCAVCSTVSMWVQYQVTVKKDRVIRSHSQSRRRGHMHRTCPLCALTHTQTST